MIPGAAERACLDRAAALAEGPVRAGAAAWSLGAEPDAALFARAGREGLFGVAVPAEHGGEGLGFAALAGVAATLAAADFGFAMAVVNTHNVAVRLCLSAPAPVRDAWVPRLLSGEALACTALTEPGTGSDVAALTTRAERDGDGWRLGGEKIWIVNARRADLAIVFAQCGDGGAGGVGGFLVDLRAEGVGRYAIESGFSQTSIGTGGFTLDRVAVTADHLLLPPGTAFKSILTEINAARAYVAAMSTAMLRTALEEVAAYGETRTSFGLPLSAHQVWRLRLAEARTDLSAAEALTERAIAQVAARADAQLSAAEAKIAAVTAAQRHLPARLHAMGAEGLRPERCFTRHLAAAQVAALTDGATDILRERVARLTRPRSPLKEG